MNHLDLFSGIGGFALAASWVWGDEHNITSLQSKQAQGIGECDLCTHGHPNHASNQGNQK